MSIQVNVQTGVPSAEIIVGDKFVWVSGNGVACTVSTPAAHLWFSPSYPNTVSVPATGTSAEVTALLEGPLGSGWPYLVNGNTLGNNPKVPVSGNIPPKKHK
jgi:hypothetical protein